MAASSPLGSKLAQQGLGQSGVSEACSSRRQLPFPHQFRPRSGTDPVQQPCARAVSTVARQPAHVCPGVTDGSIKAGAKLLSPPQLGGGLSLPYPTQPATG